MQKLKTFLTVIGAVTILVLAANSAVYAATGGKFVLGHKNKASKVSTLKRTKPGPALSLVTKSSANAPLSTNGTGMVANLNADKVDGLDASALQTQTYSWTRRVTSADVVRIDLPALPPGTYLIGYDAYMNGGGTDTGTAQCYFWRGFSGSEDYDYYAETASPTKSGAAPSLSGASVVTLAPGDALHFFCRAPQAFSTVSNEPIHLYAARTASAGGGAVRLAPGARSGH